MPSSQTPRTSVAPLGTPCSACGHSRNWHRHDDNTCSQCSCPEFTTEASSKGGAQAHAVQDDDTHPAPCWFPYYKQCTCFDGLTAGGAR